MMTDVMPGWESRIRKKYETERSADHHYANGDPLPGVTYLSDLLKVIDMKRQTGYTDDDLPLPFDMPKSYAHVPHQYLAPDGFPKSHFWLHSECISAIPPKEGQKYGKGRLSQTALNRYRDQGVEGLPEPFQRPVKTYSKPGPRHPKRSSELTAARAEDQSTVQQSHNTFNRSCDRFNDPVLPYENYDRTMDIISHLYNVVDHGRGQFVDRRSKKLIFTYAFEDLESMTPEDREAHQKDVSTILMSTELFRKLPIPKKSPSTMSCDLPPQTTNVQPKLPASASSFHYKSPDVDSPPSSPLTSLPPSDSEHENPVENTLHDQINPPSSPLSSLPSSDLDDAPVLPYVSKKRKRTELSDVDIQIPKKKRNVTSNAALINGKMYCFGQTVGYSSDILLSPYIPYKGSSKPLYLEFLSRLPDFGHRIGSRFKSFCKEGFRVARQLLIDLKAPPMASTSKEQTPGPDDFSCNFAFTFDNFYNKPHTDNDKGKVYCIWYPIDSKTGKIVTFNEGFLLEGGWFIFPEYRVAINFGNWSAVQISWNGKSTFHHTLPSKEKDEVIDGVKVHYTRLGCSSQITDKIAVAAGKRGTKRQYNYTSNCKRKVRDVEDILALEDRDWKG